MLVGRLPVSVSPMEPLERLDDWDDFVAELYPTPVESGGKRREDYRDFEAPPRDTVREFYRLNHRHQTWDFVQDKKAEYLTLDRAELSAWEALEFLNTLVDDSDPDLDLSQLDHLLQTAEAIRADGHPDWFVLAGLVHDLGKVLCLWGEPQWAVVGDTFPVGCAFSDRIVYPELFEGNPDTANATYSTPLGVYEPGCGLGQVYLSWGHDEYLYQVLSDCLPEPALYMIRYHSFYACHREGAYRELMNDRDREMFAWVRLFNGYDLYSKSDKPPDAAELRPYYQGLIDRYLPAKLNL